MIKIVFIVQQLSQPRCIKRIESFQNMGANVEVYGFDNNLYNENLKNLPFEIREIWKIDRSMSRLKKILYYRSKIRVLLKKQDLNSVIYAFGFEIGSIVSFIGRNKFIYEEADLTAARFNSQILQRFFKLIDRRNINKASCTILTSRGFIDYIFPKGRNLKDIYFFENKLHPSFKGGLRPSITSIDTDKIKFGFVGLIRYPDTIFRFAEIIGIHFPEHEFHFYGDCEDSLKAEFKAISYPNIFKHGKFINPKDLNEIYQNIDINVVCYDTQSGNVKVAEPNKLYESIYFKKPLVVSKGTFLEKRVKSLNVGFSVNASEDWDIKQFVDSIKKIDIENFMQNCQSIRTEDLIDDNMISIKEIISSIKG